MSTYRTTERVLAKLIRDASADEFEKSLNEWLGNNEIHVSDIMYQYSQNANGGVYTCLITYSNKELEPSM